MQGHPYPEHLKLKARFLKSNGDSVREIAETLGVGKSAVGKWVSGMHEEPAMLKYCVKCGDAFLAGRRDATRCPGGCDRAPRQPRKPPPVRLCKLCGVEFKRPGPARYCSIEHRAEYVRIERRKNRKTYRRTCKKCHCDFIAQHGNQRLCPMHTRKRTRPVGRRLRWCPYCGVKFVPEHGNQKFCHKGHQRLYRQDSNGDAMELVAA